MAAAEPGTSFHRTIAMRKDGRGWGVDRVTLCALVEVNPWGRTEKGRCLGDYPGSGTYSFARRAAPTGRLAMHTDSVDGPLLDPPMSSAEGRVFSRWTRWSASTIRRLATLLLPIPEVGTQKEGRGQLLDKPHLAWTVDVVWCTADSIRYATVFAQLCVHSGMPKYWMSLPKKNESGNLREVDPGRRGRMSARGRGPV